MEETAVAQEDEREVWLYPTELERLADGRVDGAVGGRSRDKPGRLRAPRGGKALIHRRAPGEPHSDWTSLVW